MRKSICYTCKVSHAAAEVAQMAELREQLNQANAGQAEQSVAIESLRKELASDAVGSSEVVQAETAQRIRMLEDELLQERTAARVLRGKEEQAQRELDSLESNIESLKAQLSREVMENCRLSKDVAAVKGKLGAVLKSYQIELQALS